MQAIYYFRMLLAVLAIQFAVSSPAMSQRALEFPLGSAAAEGQVAKALWEQYARELNAILKTRFDEEKQFIDEVVAEVRKKKIPRSLVDSSWQWVRKKRPFTRSSFVYFERVLRLQAGKLNIKIPDFDYSIYSSSNR